MLMPLQDLINLVSQLVDNLNVNVYDCAHGANKGGDAVATFPRFTPSKLVKLGDVDLGTEDDNDKAEFGAPVVLP